MKKFLITVLMGIFSLCYFASGAAWAGAVKLPIVLSAGDQEILTDDQAIVRDNGVLIPADLVEREIYGNSGMNYHNKQVQIRFALPRIATGNPAVDKMIFKAITLALPYHTVDGMSYIEAETAGKLLGFTLEKTESIIIRLNQYSSFAPLRLKRSTPPPSIDGQKINLVWQPTFEEEHNLARLDKHKGLNVLAPSWFSIINEEGLIKNGADAAYVQKAHEKGYQVWALITNSFDPDLTSKILHSEKARKNVIRQLLIYSSLYELDGINLDFENIYDTDRDALTSFVQEINAALKLIDGVVSIDVTVPSNVSQWSTCYDRKSLGESVDYMMLMAYDEHWRTSPVSGSVASLGWVENGIMRTLEEVPAAKLVLGVPFYMREWQEDLGDNNRVRAKTMTMQQAEQKIVEKNLQPIWLEAAGQHYFEYQEDNMLYRVWQEDAHSLALKTGLIEKYQLAGVAGWRKGFEKMEIWDVIYDALQGEDLRLAAAKQAADQEKKKP